MTKFEDMYKYYLKSLELLHEASTYDLPNGKPVDKKALAFSQKLASHTAELMGAVSNDLNEILAGETEENKK